MAKVWEIEARPFGDGVTVIGTGSLNLRFPGQYFDAETGLNYNFFRDYHPGIGRYIQKDPIGFNGGINLYSYTLNNPINWIDPTGLAPDPTCVAAYTATGALIGGCAGTYAGGTGGAVVGAAAGTVVEPGGGTVLGGVLGAEAGATTLGPLGTLGGGALGNLIGNVVCKDRFEDCKNQWIADTKWCDNNFKGRKNVACHRWAEEEFSRCTKGNPRQPLRL